MSAPPAYPIRDFRRLLMVLGAIAELRKDATLVKLAVRTGLDKHTITGLISQAIEQTGVDIEKNGPVYRIVHWGNVIRSTGAREVLNAPSNARLRKPR
jgi:hypothetical protein